MISTSPRLALIMLPLLLVTSALIAFFILKTEPLFRTVQAKLGARHAAAYDVFAACTGFIYGLSIARGMIGTGQADTVLLIGVETLSRITDYTDRNTCVLFGDGAGAAVLQPCAAGDGILAISIQSDGALGEVLEIPAGGSRLPASAETVAARGHYIKMRGRELFKIAVRAMEDSLRNALERSELPVDEIDVLIPHQANLRIIDAVRQRYPDVTALIVFPHFEPDEILELATSGARLPAGITRHLIRWRALRVNVPIERLADRSQTLERKNSWLREWLAERVSTRHVRYYEEPTVLFDE